LAAIVGSQTCLLAPNVGSWAVLVMSSRLNAGGAWLTSR
jgi:hypothetical protein